MAHMIPDVDYFVAYRVSTECGDELVPEDACGEIDLAGEPTAAEWRHLQDFLEGDRIAGVERVEGYFGRLSAPGYLDCTEWDGPYATAEEALAALKEQYGVDDDGNEDDGSNDESAAPPGADGEH